VWPKSGASKSGLQRGTNLAPMLLDRNNRGGTATFSEQDLTAKAPHR
jgi:hypothetical protein